MASWVDDGANLVWNVVVNSKGISTKSYQLAPSRSWYARRFPTLEFSYVAILRTTSTRRKMYTKKHWRWYFSEIWNRHLLFVDLNNWDVIYISTWCNIKDSSCYIASVESNMSYYLLELSTWLFIILYPKDMDMTWWRYSTSTILASGRSCTIQFYICGILLFLYVKHIQWQNFINVRTIRQLEYLLHCFKHHT